MNEEGDNCWVYDLGARVMCAWEERFLSPHSLRNRDKTISGHIVYKRTGNQTFPTQSSFSFLGKVFFQIVTVDSTRK